MAKKRSIRRGRQGGSGGSLLTAFVVLLAIGACLLYAPPTPEEVVAVFGKGSIAPASEVSAIVLPEKNWYLVVSGGKPVAACGALLEAEIAREAQGELSSIEQISTEEITLRVTASPSQLEALQQGADALSDTFTLLEQMVHIPPEDAVAVARMTEASLAALCGKLDHELRGTENPVVRGLSGLVGSCKDAMSDLQNGASLAQVQKTLAGLAQQYQSYTLFLSGTASGKQS